MKLYFSKQCSKKDTSKNYSCIYADLGYTKKVLTFDKSVIQEILNMTAEEFFNIPVGTVKEIGIIEVR